MNPQDSISESQINAFVDDELHNNDRAQVIDALNNDPTVEQRVNDIRKDMDLLKLAYQYPPAPHARKAIISSSQYTKPYLAFAASLLLVIGSMTGFILSSMTTNSTQPSFSSMSNFVVDHSKNEKIMIHISRMDDKKITQALDKAEEILTHSEQDNKALDLVVIANESGLGLLKQGSPYAKRVHELSSKHKNVKFLACGIAMEVSKLKEGKDVTLLPDAEKIPAALTDILERLEGGWLYIKS